MKSDSILKIIVVLAIVSVVCWLIIEHGVKKWSCNEGQCEKVIGGDFSSLEKCRNSCASAKCSKPRYVRFSPKLDIMFIEPRSETVKNKVHKTDRM